MFIPSLGLDASTAMEEVHVTRTVAGGAHSAVCKRIGRRSCVGRYWPRQFVVICSSCPYVETELRGRSETPGLNKKPSLDSFATKASTAGSVVIRSSRESKRKLTSPEEIIGQALMIAIEA